MLDFSEVISPVNRLRLRKLDEWLPEYLPDALIGEELDPVSMQLGRSVQPTICSFQDIHDIEVLEATHLGDGIVEARCEVGLCLELDLNNEEDETAISGATMEITIQVNMLERKIASHHVHDASAPDPF